MKKIIFTLLVASGFFCSCEKYPESGLLTIENLFFSIYGNNQFAEANQYLTDSVGIIIDMQTLILERNHQFTATFNVVEGGGTVDQPIVQVGENGKAFTRWKIGNESNDQKLKIVLSDSEGNPLDSIQLNATCYFNDKWNEIKSGLLTSIADMVSDSVNQCSYMLAGGRVYKNGAKFYQWELTTENQFSTAHNIEINRKGELFIGTWDGNLYKSDDQGKTWLLCTKPIEGYSGYFELTITPDDYIWVSYWNQGIRCSKNGGLNWTINTSGINGEEYLGRVYNYGDGAHISYANGQMTIYKTVDDGINWTPMNAPIYPLTCYVTKKDELIVLNQEKGYSLFKLPYQQDIYQPITSALTEYRTTPMSHTFENYRNNYYVLLPGGGLWRTSNFEKSDFQKIGDFTLQRFLYVDHRGNIYANGFSGETAYILAE